MAQRSSHACKNATQPVQHSLLLSRTRIALRACLANTDANKTSLRTRHAAFRWQTPAIPACHHVFRRQYWYRRIDPGEHKTELRSRRARRAARSWEVDVEVYIARQVGLGASIEYGGCELGGELGVYGAVAGHASVPCSRRARDPGESNTGDSCRKLCVSTAISHVMLSTVGTYLL
jgi:hypothetical protein